MQRFIDKNFTSGRQGNSPQFVVIHTYNGAGRSLYNWFNNVNAQVSAHYAVFKDGDFEQYVGEENTAWHAGNWDANTKSIGIEHQDDGNPSDSFRTNELYERSAQLIADIYRRYGWDINNKGLIKPHKEFTSTGCPGGLDLNRIRNRVYEILHPQPVQDNLYRVKRGNEQLGAFKEKDNAFNLWYDNKDTQVILNNQNITSEFLTMATNLEKQLQDAQSASQQKDDQIMNLKAEKQELDNKLKNTSKNLEMTQESLKTSQEQINALQLQIEAYKKYEAIEKVITKIKNLFIKLKRK